MASDIVSKTHALGIDLGTSNCALALGADEGIETLEITQALGPGRIGERRAFASALYFPASGQFPPESLRLPWQAYDPPWVAGDFAREAGAQAPNRLVVSAKSWLSYRSVDPTRPILPWGADIEAKVSPLEASRLYLEHLREAHAAECERRGLESAIEAAQVILTVPASFDEAARKLTARAADEAGLGQVVLLEEPQAAFYAWLGAAGPDWRNLVRPGELVLVCDVGGGTTDFSLIAVTSREGNLELERISVGRHILLGGDNMDLALAFALRRHLEEEGRILDDWQFQALTFAVRSAKETLFESPDIAEAPLSIPSRGSGLVSGTIAATLSRELVNAVVLDGFFALTAPDDMPAERPSAGLREMGLPYEADAVVSRHLAAFLSKSLRNAQAGPSAAARGLAREEHASLGLLHPDAVLFNGGVFRSAPMRDRVLELLRSWNPDHAVRELAGTDPDMAVARGAAVYGRTKFTGKGVRIRAGASRSYYLGLDPSAPAVPGYRPPVKAVCVVPQGMEEGTEHVLEDREFGLLTGAPATFRFFTSSARAGDAVGSLVQNAERDLEESARLEMEVPPVDGEEETSVVPVKLHARLSELGTLELWMQRPDSGQRWELHFNVRTE